MTKIEKEIYRCGIRQLLVWRKEWGLKKFREYTYSYTMHPKWWRYSNVFTLQWRLGNRGNKNQWIGN